MGLEMWYQGLPGDCDLIKRAREDRELGEILSEVPSFFRVNLELWPKPWPEAERLLHILRDLAARHPGLEKRNFTLDKQWDLMHFLLSATRRGETQRPVDLLMDKAVLGDCEIGEHVKATQGMPLKMVTAQDVRLIAEVLMKTDWNDIGKYYTVERVKAGRVYKHGLVSEEWRGFVTEYFEGFRAFYWEAAARGEMVIACCD